MKHPQVSAAQSFRHLWGWPIVLGVMTLVGLVSALFSDGGFGDMLAWVMLGIPVGVCAWFGLRRQPAGER